MKKIFLFINILFFIFVSSSISAQFDWIEINSTSNAKIIALGKLDSDNFDDLVGVWGTDLWVRYSTSGAWLKIDKPRDQNGSFLCCPLGISIGDLPYKDLATGEIKKGIYVIYPTGIWTLQIK